MHTRLLFLFLTIVALAGCEDNSRVYCTPQCDGRACGSDGCGGSCGTCDEWGTQCSLGACVRVACGLARTCDLRACGSDGCGGSCGTCPKSSTCNDATGQCIERSIRGNLFIEAYSVYFDAYHLPRLDQKAFIPGHRIPLSYRDADGDEIAQATVGPDGSFKITLPRVPYTSDWISIVPLWHAGQKPMAAVVNANSRLWNWSIPVRQYADPDAPNELRDIRITTEQYSGALYLYQQIVAAFLGIQSNGFFLNFGRLPSVAVVWSPGKTWDCGTCIESTPVSVGKTKLQYALRIGAGPDDEGPWGYPTLLHEMGHYVLKMHRDDNPGGAHTISNTSEPRLAWSEGWATFFSLLMRSFDEKKPVSQYWRVVGTGSYWIDYARLYESSGAGSLYVIPPRLDNSLGMRQDLSEAWITYMLWDLFDGINVPEASDTDDGVALPLSAFTDVIFSDRYRALDRYDDGRTPSGADFVDYLDAVSCDEDIAPDDAQRMHELLVQRGFPYDGTPVCTPR